MKAAPRLVSLILSLGLGGVLFSLSGQAANPGIFEGAGDVGVVGKPGSVVFAAEQGTYSVTGGGGNMWFTNDAMHFVWTKVSGDQTLAAEIAWPKAGGNSHRKACLMFRQDLDPRSTYADVAVHGDGLTSLQYRETAGDLTHEIQSSVAGPQRVRLEKHGEYVSMSVAGPGESLHPAGGSFRLHLQEPYYVGLAVCAHDDQVTETAVFSKVTLTSPVVHAGVTQAVASTLETIPIGSKDRRAIYYTTNRIEAPNWTRDGKSLIYNSKGHLFKMAATGGAPEPIDTGFAMRCNNDHGLSPDGTLLAISDQSQERKSLIYVLPVAGGAPRRITLNGPSYWHGWSPDGKTLAFCGERNTEFDIYTISVEGGEEHRLTTAKGLDDGPEYSPDGKYIYFNSERSGTMQIWRMKPDGSEQEQVTADEFNNWFPHVSPDGKWIAYLAYPKEVKGHPENQDVVLRMLPAGGGPVQTLAKLFGGQGTINVPSWSPDSKKLAFVSYQYIYPAGPAGMK